MITNDFPLDTKILLFDLSYSQKIFFGYSIIQFPVSIFPLIFCSKLKFILFVFFNLYIIFDRVYSLIGALLKVSTFKSLYVDEINVFLF